MGTANFDVTKYGRNRGSGGANVASSSFRLSGNFTTSTTAQNLEDAGGDITMAQGEVLHIEVDEAARIVFGGGTATATNGMLLSANVARDIECNDPGLVSIVDIA